MRASSGRWPKINRRTVVAITAGLVVLGFWWWPGLVGRGADVDVSVHVNPDFAPGRESIERRLREQGWRVEWSEHDVDWCDVADEVEQSDSEADDIVLWMPTGATCGAAADIASDIASDIAASAKGRTLHVVDISTGRDPVVDALVALGARVVEAGRLVGEPGTTADCLWWEDCPATGRIDTWSGDQLSPAGLERVARAIVAEVR